VVAFSEVKPMRCYFKRWIFCLFFLISVCFLFGDSPDTEQRHTYYFSEKLHLIFYELCDLVENSNPANEILVQRIDLIRSKIEHNKLLLLMTDEALSNALFGAYFSFSLDNSKQKPVISLDKYLLALYPRQKSLVFSLLIHELQHAYNYFMNYKAFITTYNNLLENYLYEMDAYHVEALFIRDVLMTQNFPLTDFEKLLVSSFENDNLDYFSFVFKNLDMRLVYYLYNVTLNKQSAEENIEELIHVGKELIDFFKFPEQDDEWKQFVSLIPMHTYCRFIQQCVYNVLVEKAQLEMAPEDFFLPDHSRELYDLVLKMQELLNPHNQFFITYSRELAAYFGESLHTEDDVFKEVTNYEFLVCADIIHRYIHIDPNDSIEVGDIVNPNSPLGEPLKEPALLSEKYDKNIRESISLYNAGNYEQAAKLLEQAAQDEPSNPFVLYNYARALYRHDREKSYSIYSQLIELLDAQTVTEYYVEIKPHTEILNEIEDKELQQDIIAVQREFKKLNYTKTQIDMWFVEAYWKIGTLHLDRKEYLKAAFEITRGLKGGLGAYKKLKEQAYQYLTEAYFHQKKYALALYCAQKTLEINSENTYVQKYLKEIGKIKN
jgi:hypothetical protein